MAANLADHMPIRAVKTFSGNSPATRSIEEKATQTFLDGVPVQINAGYVQEWDGATLANGICGFSKTGGLNLATDGKGAPAPYGVVGPPGTSVTYGSVSGQPLAVNIPPGAPMSDGRTIMELAIDDNVFVGQIDHSGAGAYASLQSMIGQKAGLTKDATGHWYVDLNKANAVIIQGFDKTQALGTNGAMCYFTVLDTVQQLVS